MRGVFLRKNVNVNFLHIFKAMGLDTSNIKDGICAGIAAVAARAICNGPDDDYWVALEVLHDHPSLLAKSFKEYLPSGSLNGGTLPPKLGIILKVLKDILFFQGQFDYLIDGAYSEKISSRQAAILQLDLFSMNLFREKSLPTTHDTKPLNRMVGYFTYELCEQLLEKIKNAEQPVAYILDCANHAITIGGSGEDLYLINHNHHKKIPLTTTTPSERFTLIYSSLFQDETVNPRNGCCIQPASDYSNELLQSIEKPKIIVDTASLEARSSLLSIALVYGSVADVTCYLDALNQSTLSDEDFLALLSAKTQRGVTGFSHALTFGRTDVVNVFMSAVMDSRLNEESKLTLLAAENLNGSPALLNTFILENHKMIRCYLENLLNSKKFDWDVKKNLIIRVTTHVISNTAREDGLVGCSFDTLKNYTDFIRSACISILTFMPCPETEKKETLDFRYNLCKALDDSFMTLYLCEVKQWIFKQLEDYSKLPLRLFDNREKSRQKKIFSQNMMNEIQACICPSDLQKILQDSKEKYDNSFGNETTSRLGSFFINVQEYCRHSKNLSAGQCLPDYTLRSVQAEGGASARSLYLE
jgi:hypothetical protein